MNHFAKWTLHIRNLPRMTTSAGSRSMHEKSLLPGLQKHVLPLAKYRKICTSSKQMYHAYDATCCLISTGAERGVQTNIVQQSESQLLAYW